MKRVLLIGIIVIILVPLIAYGLDMPSNFKPSSNEFFYAETDEGAPSDTVTLTIDLSKIKYDDFEFSLTSSTGVTEISADAPTTVQNNELKITGNKSEYSTINLLYKIPENAKVGDTISLVGKITSKGIEQVTEMVNTTVSGAENNIGDTNTVDNANIVDDTNTILDSVNNTIENTEIVSQVVEKEVSENLEAKITIKVVAESNSKKDNDDDKMSNMTMDKNMMDKDMMNKNMMMDRNMTMEFSESQSMKASGTTNTVTYKGDSNNYLSTLSISGYEFTTEFSKTNTTYFVNVDSSTEKLSITATAEDSTAKVTIYGNKDLEEGTNKILVTVTADNGDTRTYRIYAIKEG